jgi:ketosteroid isomerase-like protein
MSADENVKLVKSIMDEFMRTGDPAAFFGAITEDTVIKAIIPPGTPLSGDFQGQEGFRRYFAALGEVMEILDLKDIHYVGSASRVVALGVEKARVKRTGAIFESEIATVFMLEQGKITTVAALADMSTIVDAYRVDRAS